VQSAESPDDTSSKPFDLFRFLEDSEEEETKEETKQEDDEDDITSLADYLRTLVEEEENEAPLTPTEDAEEDAEEESFELESSSADKFDIIAFLSQQAEETEDILLTEDMAAMGEKTRVITLEELTRFNEIRKKKRL